MSTPQDHHFMEQALLLAKQAEQHGEIPVGAVLVYKGKIIGRGWNHSITSHDATGHAEIMALRDAGRHIGNYRLTDTTLYVTLEPCPMCAGATVHARVSRLVFGAFDPKTGAAGSVFNLTCDDRLNHQLDVEGGVEHERCSELLSEFFRNRRKAIKAAKKLKTSQQD